METWTVSNFGSTKSGHEIKEYTAKNGTIEVSVIDFGCIIMSIKVPDKRGHVKDVVAGYDTVAGYEEDTAYIGATVGRVANRIAEGKFTLDGKEYQLAVNNPPNHLHGGIEGFNKKIWAASVDGSKLKMTYNSPAGEESYPGSLDICVTHELQNNGTLVVDYMATTDSATIVNITNHSYFNLSGHDARDIKDHTVQINAERYTPTDSNLIPTGELASVAGTVFDLRHPVRLGDVLYKVGSTGYDNNFCLGVEAGKKSIGRVEHHGSGRFLEMHTTQPGVQFYTSHYLGCTGKSGVTYEPYTQFCLEPQNYPDAINKDSFPNCVLRAGELYKQTTWYTFGVDKSD